MKELIYKYHSKTELGKMMTMSKSITYSDLLFMMPNNVKRRYGLPVTRTYGKRKSDIKRIRRHRILSVKVFDILEELVQELLLEKFQEETFIAGLIDVKNVSTGDKDWRTLYGKRI